MWYSWVLIITWRWDWDSVSRLVTKQFRKMYIFYPPKDRTMDKSVCSSQWSQKNNCLLPLYALYVLQSLQLIIFNFQILSRSFSSDNQKLNGLMNFDRCLSDSPGTSISVSRTRLTAPECRVLCRQTAGRKSDKNLCPRGASGAVPG